MTTTTEPTETPEAFRIDNDQAANWLLRKLANIETEKARISAQAAQMVRELDADAQRLRHLYEGELQEFARAQLAANGGRRKSLTLLQGTLAFRTVPAGIRISDQSAALDYARRVAQDALYTVETLDTAVYRQLAERALQTGELLPGIDQTEARESFTVKF